MSVNKALATDCIQQLLTQAHLLAIVTLRCHFQYSLYFQNALIHQLLISLLYLPPPQEPVATGIQRALRSYGISITGAEACKPTWMQRYFDACLHLHTTHAHFWSRDRRRCRCQCIHSYSEGRLDEASFERPRLVFNCQILSHDLKYLTDLFCSSHRDLFGPYASMGTRTLCQI